MNPILVVLMSYVMYAEECPNNLSADANRVWNQTIDNAGRAKIMGYVEYVRSKRDGPVDCAKIERELQEGYDGARPFSKP